MNNYVLKSNCNCTRCKSLNNVFELYNSICSKILQCYDIKFDVSTLNLITTIKDCEYNNLQELKRDFTITQLTYKRLLKIKCLKK